MSQDKDRGAREPRERGPGAHSGAEQQATRRTVPGTASAAEGYRPGEGTEGGEPLRGVEAEQRDTDTRDTGEEKPGE